jgi:hypothetical protein
VCSELQEAVTTQVRKEHPTTPEYTGTPNPSRACELRFSTTKQPALLKLPVFFILFARSTL